MASPSTSTNDSAVQRVLRLPELLERILLHLTPLEVLRASSISHTFENNIKGSIQLQKYLCFRADDTISEDDRQPNPLLDSFPVSNNEYRLTIINVRRAFGAQSYDYGENLLKDDAIVQLGRVPKPGSCARMFLSQPPATVVHVCAHIYRLPELSVAHSVMVVKNDEGVTWGDICAHFPPKDYDYFSAEERQRVQGAASMERPGMSNSWEAYMDYKEDQRRAVTAEGGEDVQ